jgi:ABC-type sugar transport system substrate-binding protein
LAPWLELTESSGEETSQRSRLADLARTGLVHAADPSAADFLAFDAGETLNAGLKAGDVAGFVVQNPLAMGYLGVKTVVAAIRGEKVPAAIDTGVGFVTKENMNDPAVADLLNPPLDKYLK